MTKDDCRRPPSAREISRHFGHWRQTLTTPDVARHLSNAARKVITYLALIRAAALRDHPQRAPLVRPAQSTIGAACGITRETVNRAVHGELAPFGLVTVTRPPPHPVTGQFAECRYAVTDYARRLLGLAFKLGPRPSEFNRVMYTSHDTIGVPFFSTGIADISSNRPP